MQTRSSPSLQTLHRLARQASIPDYKSLSKGALYRRLQEQFDIERLQRAESRGSKAKQSHNDAEVEKADVDCVHRKKKARKSHKDKESFDPIMREPLGKHIYTFQRPNGSCAQFNVESLVDYLLCSGDFTDPESRLPFSDKDLRDIDNVAIKAGLKKASVLAAKRENSEIYADRNFVRDALQGLERCAGEVVVEMLNIVEECDPEEAEMRLLMREFPMFSDLYRQIKVADATYAKQCMRSWQLYLRGPPNKPTQDEYGLLHVVLHFMRCLEMHGNQPGVWNPPRLHSSYTSPSDLVMSAASLSSYELESLFIEKLTQKFQLTERDMKRAFSLYDTDGNGLLSLNELIHAFEKHLVGVKRQQIEELIRNYDINGDGFISFEEFYGFLINRNAVPRDDKSKTSSKRRDRKSVPDSDPEPVYTRPMYGRKTHYSNPHAAPPPARASEAYAPSEESEPYERSDVCSEYDSELSSAFNPDDGGDIESRVKVFLQNLKSYLLREALLLRREERVANRLLVHANKLSENVGKALILRAFEKSSHATARSGRVNLKSFCSVLKSYPLPGLPNVRMEVFQYLFSLCCDEEEPNLADPNAFVELLFGSSSNHTRANVQRQVYHRPGHVGHGPVKDKSGDGNNLPNESTTLTVKDKYICSKSRTTYLTPTTFTVEDLQASACPPACKVNRSYVFGLRLADLYSGQGIHCLPPIGRGDRQRVLVYAASSMGVVHDLSSNTQIFFDKHSDELTCINIDRSGTYALTGQLGKDPALYVWEIRTAKFVKRVGAGFFSFAVCAACFSYDARYVCAIGCDENHSIGIWDVNTDRLICQSTCSKGVFPNVRSLTWAPEPQLASHINRQIHGQTDVFVTSGAAGHLSFWAFQRPDKNGLGGSLVCRAARMGQIPRTSKTKATKMTARGGAVGAATGRSKDANKSTVGHAQVYHCSAYIQKVAGDTPIERGNTYNVVTGGNNGYLYLWDNCVCIQTIKASRGDIRAIKVVGETIFCGCMEGSVKVFDALLRMMGEFSTASQDISAPPTPLSRQRGRPSTPTNRRSVLDSGAGNRRGGINPARPKSASRAIRKAPPVGAGNYSAGIRTREDSASHRPSTSHSDGAKVSAANNNSVLALDMDFSPFFYADARGGASGETLIVAMANGHCVRVHIDSPVDTPATRVFSYHIGAVWALSGTGSLGTLVATGGDDRWMCIWCLKSKALVCRARMQAAARCCHFDKSNKFIAVGMARGNVGVHYFDYKGSAGKGRDSHAASSISEVLASRCDCSEDIADIKFNPTSDMLAAGSHDNFIDVYSVELNPPSKTTSASAVLRPLKRLRGHSSYVTHLDWSLDGRLIQSTCGAYELLYWDPESGRQFSYTTGWNPSDVRWKTYTCVLGFSVMGIWPQYADGTDINSLHVSRDKTLVATADDSGQLNVLNYPCVIKNAPRKSYTGHSSHVTNVRFVCDDRMIVTTGGNDKCVIVWEVEKTKLHNPAPQEAGWR